MRAEIRLSAGVRSRADSQVFLRVPNTRDSREFLATMTASRALHHPWVDPPTDRDRFGTYLERIRGPSAGGFFVCRREDQAIVGVINLNNIVLGARMGAALGYYGCSTHAGRGYMTDGLQLVLAHAFGTLGLHRLEANIQPANTRSLSLVRRCGFRREGFSPSYLFIAGRWRDHERWALAADEPYR